MDNMHPGVVEHILNIIEEWPPHPEILQEPEYFEFARKHHLIEQVPASDRVPGQAWEDRSRAQ